MDLGGALRLDVAFDNFQRRTANRDQTVGIRPELLFPELLPNLGVEAFENATGRRFERVDEGTHGRIRLRAKQEVDVIGLAVELLDLDAMDGSNLTGHGLDLVQHVFPRDNFAPVLDHQNEVVVEAEHGMVV